MGLLLLFFDGVGVGRDDAAENPFAQSDARWLAPLAGRPPASGSGFRPIDARLGIPGLPQSATGQTTLLTGVNASRHLGYHQFGLPGPSLRPLLARDSIFLKLVRAGGRPTFANAFSREHLAAGLPFRLGDVEGRDGTALWHDYTGEWMTSRGHAAPRLSAVDAAAVLVGLVEQHDFVLYEYFLTDLVAHRGTREQMLEQARRAEGLVDAVLARIDLGRHHVVLTSDHGNLEQATHSRHTLNPVPLLVWGPRSDRLLDRVEDLTDVTPAILAIVGDAGSF
jgi:2,3-bisphosphoglycerate-independent phosphoglycerate mutase